MNFISKIKSKYKIQAGEVIYQFLKTTSKEQLGSKLYAKIVLIRDLTVEDLLDLLKGYPN